jgi:hypothetical protein
VVAALPAPFVRGLTEIALHGDLSLKGIAALRRKLDKLTLLDVRKTRLAEADRDRLRVLATTVLIDEPATSTAAQPTKAIGAWLVRHTRKPEWGTGRVVEETDGGLEVEFEHGGTKLVRNVELLEDVSG